MYKNYSYITYPYEENSTVLDYVLSANAATYRISNAEVKTILIGALKGIYELEALSKLYYLDLKLENMVISDDERIKLINFRQACSKSCQTIDF